LLRVDLPDGRVIEYLHDALGRRAAKKVNGQLLEKYLWEGRTTLLAIYDAHDNLKQRFEYAGGRLPVSMVQSGATYYFAYDQVGTMRAVYDAAGQAVKTVEYDSFGNVFADSAPGFAVPFGFAGGLYDADTGLVRFGYRDYDADIGRWTAKDPIGFAGGDTDLMGYVFSCPVLYTDESGLYRQRTPGIIYDESGNIVGEIPLDEPFLDPIDFLTGKLPGKGIIAVAASIRKLGPSGKPMLHFIRYATKSVQRMLLNLQGK